MFKLILFSISILMFSCNDGDSPTDPGAGVSNISESDLEGTWTLISDCETYEDGCPTPSEDCETSGFDFEFDYTFSNNVVTACYPPENSFSYCEEIINLVFGEGDNVSTCDVDPGCSDLSSETCLEYEDVCVVTENQECYYYDEDNPSGSETFSPF